VTARHAFQWWVGEDGKEEVAEERAAEEDGGKEKG
jgi:hypothetical protein